MARTPLTPVTAPGSADYDGQTLTFTAVDGDGGSAPFSGRKLLIIAKNGGGAAADFTVSGPANRLDRTATVTLEIAAAGFAVFGPYEPEGWAQTDGSLYFLGETSDVVAAAVWVP